MEFSALSSWYFIVVVHSLSCVWLFVTPMEYPMGYHTRIPCPSLSPRVCSNLCPLSQWCYPTISFSIDPLSSCPQSSPASGSFPMNQLFTSDGQSIGASASVLPMNIQDWFPLGWLVLSPCTLRESSSKPQLESINSLALSFLYGPTLTSIDDY